jgi:hypothetical protein
MVQFIVPRGANWHPDAPPSVRHWATTPPDWLKIHSDPEEPDQTLAALDPGERTALRLTF